MSKSVSSTTNVRTSNSTAHTPLLSWYSRRLVGPTGMLRHIYTGLSVTAGNGKIEIVALALKINGN